jgi:hypothetical protein
MIPKNRNANECRIQNNTLTRNFRNHRKNDDDDGGGGGDDDGGGGGDGGGSIECSLV